ncbi:hypothetical protein ACFQH6_14875 [Halobacteriaceae archaeon GCM10025711]
MPRTGRSRTRTVRSGGVPPVGASQAERRGDRIDGPGRLLPASGVDRVDRPGDYLLAVKRQVRKSLRWALVYANRGVLTLLIEFVIFAGLIAVGTVWEFEVQVLVTETLAVQTLFNTLLGGMILLVSIVVSINSIVLTQEVSSLGTQKKRIEDTIEFRQNLENTAEMGVSPVEPKAFLSFVLSGLRNNSSAIDHFAGENRNQRLRMEVEAYLDDINQQVERMSDRLEGIDPRSKNVLFIGLEYSYSWQIYTARRFQTEYADELSDGELDAFDELIRMLKFFATGLEYFKTLYIKRELANLSSSLLLVSLPAIVFTSYALLALDAQAFPSFTVFSLSRHLLYVSLGYTIAFSPFVLLSTYIIRVVIVSQYSLAAGPFVHDPARGKRTRQ